MEINKSLEIRQKGKSMIEIKDVKEMEETVESEVVKTYITTLPSTNDSEMMRDITENRYSVKSLTNCLAAYKGQYRLVTTVVYVPR